MALGIAASLFSYADAGYRGSNPNALSGQALVDHQTNVLSGKIVLVPNEARVPDEESIRQVKTANDFLARQPHAIQAELAAINYGAFFRPQTMAGATRTLDRQAIDELLETASTSHEAMPHLSVSNWAIGQTVAGVYENLSKSEQPKKLRIVDIGSGHGATIVAITNSIHNIGDVNSRPELAITALEPTPEFFEELVNFAKNSDTVSSLGLKSINQETNSGAPISEFGSLTMVHGDAASELLNSDIGNWENNNEITIITGNYSWHRLGTGKKAELMKLFSKLPNVIFLIGDLENNTSDINERYFNDAVNGPLNPGNLFLNEQFSKWGYFMIDIAKQRPRAMDPRIARRLTHDHKYNDGHFYIARWGKDTYDVLDLAPTELQEAA